MATPALDIRLKRISKIYKEGETISGVAVVDSKFEVSHQGLYLILEGKVNMQMSEKNVGLMDAFYNSIKPILICGTSLELVKAGGKLPAGRSEIPFEIPLAPKANRQLYETYHGVFINIQYILKLDMKRGMLSKDLEKTLEFIVESKVSPVKPNDPSFDKPKDFKITSESIQNIKDVYKRSIPRFSIRGHFDSLNCAITAPFTGEIVLESCEAPIRSLELQLLRVETCGCEQGYAKEVTEIQNIQVAEGDLMRGLAVPLYMVFPRLFSCPTLHTPNFKIEFELNVVMIFRDEHLVAENFPLILRRA